MPSVLNSAEVTCVGAGAARALSSGASGQVVATFSRATYVRTQQGLAAITWPGTHPGPLHAVLAEPIPRLEAGTRIHVRGLRVQMGEGVVVNLLNAKRWIGHQPNALALGAARRVASCALAPFLGGSSLLCEPWASATEGWQAAVAGADMERLAHLLGGIGPGLTPSGDDALAGVLLVARLLWGASSEPRLLGCVPRARTSELSVEFLLWAAQGQSVAPMHDLLRASVEGRQDDALRCAQLLAHVGASSGADLCLGLERALEHLPVM